MSPRIYSDSFLIKLGIVVTSRAVTGERREMRIMKRRKIEKVVVEVERGEAIFGGVLDIRL